MSGELLFLCGSVEVPCQYTFHETCAEDATLAMGDETTKIFLNSKGRREGINQNLAAFLDYIEGKTPKGKFTETIADAVEAAKENKEMKVEYMTFFMELRRREEKGREEGIAKGREEGRAEGREEGRWTTLAELVREGILTLQEAAKKAGMSEEHFRKLAAL
ncbi:MAG: hypothetical protein MR669_00225 [Selenomonadaceae bacterium]|nr:hypothetical protein [Selenomonadaceae bacterium]